MDRLKQLRRTKSISDLALILGYRPKAFSYIVYGIHDSEKYFKFDIPKKNGGTRNIKAPCPELKLLQKRLAELLSDCLREIEHAKGKEKESANRSKTQYSVSHGFKKGLSIASNADIHKKRRYVFNLDLEDFFPSFNFGRVRGFFIKDSHFRLSPKVATAIAQISCHDNNLPQGSPCSPIISNLIGRILDIRLVRLAKRHNCSYTRYADDITFSTNLKHFPLSIAFEKHGIWNIGQSLKSHILGAGFKINHKKTRMQYNDSRQMVTGLVVNQFVNVKGEYYRYARSMCHSLFNTGEFYLPHQNMDKGSVAQLEGILNHIYQIKSYRNKFASEGYRDSRHDGFRKRKNNGQYPPFNRCSQYSDESHKVAIDGIKNLYSKFLFFKHFYNSQKPTIFCEGHTDNIYLRCAIKHSASTNPNLVDQSGSPTINFFNRTQNNKEMLKIADGFSGQIFIAKSYKRQMEKYKCDGKKQPVIMIVDNDNDGRTVKSAAKTPMITINQGMHYITENLYVLEIPKLNNKDTEIEDYFDSGTLKTQLGGKTFSRKKQYDISQHYGKSIFAEHVILKNQNTVNFSQFKPILDLIESAINDYKNR